MASSIDKIEYTRRVNLVANWILNSTPQSLMVLELLRLGWADTERSAKKYIKTAYKKWSNKEDKNILRKRNAMIDKLEMTKNSLLPEYKGTPAGIRAVLEIEKQIIALEALAKPQEHKVELTSTVKHLFDDDDSSTANNDNI